MINKNGPSVLLTDNDLGDRAEECAVLERELDARVTIAQCRTEEDVLEAVRAQQPDAIVTQWAPITAAVIDELDHCAVISRIGIGLDVVDLDAAQSAGIDVRNVPDYCIEEVAAHATAMLMSLARRLPNLDSDLRSGRWNAAEGAKRIGRLSSLTLGLVGAGRIGQIVARAFKIWGTEVIVYDPYVTHSEFEQVSLEQLAERSDMISLHAPLTEENRHVIGRKFFANCTRAPILVNTSRGGLIDAAALTEALVLGLVSSAGLDVFEVEPLPADDPLRSAPNCILTAHAAWSSRQALPDLRRGAIQNVIDALTVDENRVRS
ncbi:C-terminal binding protein [Rhodococcus qingshengii]|uniref:C-terminal binding protein n=1 Tax=Rhodococcus qingshengii TaxID=334542 RepID=UPI0036DCB4C9